MRCLQVLHDIRVAHCVGNDHQIDIASCSVALLGDGTVYESNEDVVCDGEQRIHKWTSQSDGLADHGNELMVDGRVRVGLIALLIPRATDGQQTCNGELCEFTLDGTGATSGSCNQFRDRKVPIGLTEDQAEDPLLGLGEKGIGQAGAWRWGCDGGGLVTHNGHINAQYGHIQASQGERRSPAFAGLLVARQGLALRRMVSGVARRLDQANGSCRTMVWSRSGPVETMLIGQPASSSSARR